MKKSLLICASALVGLTLVGCGETSVKPSENPSSSAAKNTYKVGLGSVVNVTADATSKVVSQIDVTVVGVVFDSADKIVSTYIDVTQLPYTFTAAVTEGTAAPASLAYTATKNQTKDAGDKVVESKKELGTRYGMSKVDSNKDGTMNLEWDVQAADYENWTVGKTLAQVQAGTQTTGDKAGYGTSEVQATGATIHVADFSKAITDAATRTKTFTATAGGVVGVGMTTGAISTKYTDDTKATAKSFQTDLTFAAVASADGKVNQMIMDVYQVPFTADGALNTAATQTKDAGDSTIESKKDLGTRYGMSNAGKVEWDVQAKDLEDWTVGKTADQIKAGYQTTGDNAGYGTSEVQATGATMHASDLLNTGAEGLSLKK